MSYSEPNNSQKKEVDFDWTSTLRISSIELLLVDPLILQLYEFKLTMFCMTEKKTYKRTKRDTLIMLFSYAPA